ncbi:sodium:solute symporter family protein [Marinobacterium litorale]|uniref:sodium:solute symporter family protein n=1 Tax=Marinobacterium litorale TaxID=404770 RepID=UPI0004266F97|nr:sodium:solute symporter family protein [Marinobacterium litorale]
MFSTSLVVLTLTVYMLILFIAAQVAEKRPAGRTAWTPYIYAFALTVYFTSWGFYGNVGFAAESGLLYLGTEIGSILAVLGWWYTIRRIVRIKESYHITNIADFISARYNRSQAVAGLVTVTALFGVIPYIALQLKSIVSTISVILPVREEDWSGVGLWVMLAMIVFTVVFGARRLDPTERHPGVLVVLALQGLVKLVAILMIGIFVTWMQYDGFGDLINRLETVGLERLMSLHPPSGSFVGEWMALIILGMVGVQCLPRQFHLLVVENSHERDILTAIGIFVLYYVIFDLFIIPIAAAGLLQGLSPAQADQFVLILPYAAGEGWLALLVFIGGFSAASGMIVISAMTLSTMVTNHLMLPVIEEVRGLNFLRHRLLKLRWLTIVLIILSSYLFAWDFSDSYMLAAMGTIAFVAVLQFAPPMFGGMFWRGANRMGAIAGLLVGLLTWFYTLVIPAFSREGWFGTQWLIDGPARLDWLRPEALLGFEALSPLSHSVFWSLALNVFSFVIGSWLYSPAKRERLQLVEFMQALSLGQRAQASRPTGLEAYIPFQAKREEAVRLLSRYLPEHKAAHEVGQIAQLLQGEKKRNITIIELVEFHRMLEACLAGSIGAASAHRAVESGIGYSQQEKRDLEALHSHIGSELGTSSDYQAGGSKGRSAGFADLNAAVERQKAEVESLKAEVAKLQRKLEKSDNELFNQRLQNQKLSQQLLELRRSGGGEGNE